MKPVSTDELKRLHIPSSDSHKGQNGRLLIIGGSHLFHAASLWSLTVASRIVDLVHYASVPENNDIVQKAKEEFRNGIVVLREDLESYIEEDDCILIGPGMTRSENKRMTNDELRMTNLRDIEKIRDEGMQTKALTDYLLKKHPGKQWVIDAGALQMMDITLIPKHAILTPHHGEFEGLKLRMTNDALPAGRQELRMKLGDVSLEKQVELFAKQYQCIVLLKGEKDIACSQQGCRIIEGGNPGMTKGGTGDVLAGLVAALTCKNDSFLATIAGSVINKKAGDALYKTVGPFFNATDLANQIPMTMKEVFVRN